MSRGIRDLRDLICVSRLSGRESDDEALSDCDYSISPFDSPSPSSDRGACVKERNGDISPDSGVVTNSSQHSVNDVSVKTSHKKFNKRKYKQRSLDLLPKRHEFPKSEPLPPLQSASDESSQPVVSAGTNSNVKRKVNFDGLMIYMDATIVSGWLTKANELVNLLAEFCNSGENFVQFAHFWLTEFIDIQKQEIFNMEYEIFLDEVALAFAVGRDQGKVLRTDISRMASSLFLEYPAKLLGANSSYLFLDYLDILSSEKHERYKRLLSNVSCCTSNRQHAQWLLAIRCYALVSVWCAITNFYRNLTGRQNPVSGVPLPSNVTRLNVAYQRLYQAISLGFVDVVQYLISRDEVKVEYRDIHNRSLLFTAVMLNQPKIVLYLLENTDINVNEAADTGNTPLHAAANNGNLSVVHELLKCSRVTVDITNPQCENATPLHMAVLHGHRRIVDALLAANASRTMKMGDLTPEDIAEEFGKFQILDSLKQ